MPSAQCPVPSRAQDSRFPDWLGWLAVSSVQAVKTVQRPWPKVSCHSCPDSTGVCRAPRHPQVGGRLVQGGNLLETRTGEPGEACVIVQACLVLLGGLTMR